LDIKNFLTGVSTNRNAILNPFTFLACTNDEEDYEWMHEIEEVAVGKYVAAVNDFRDEKEEVKKDQGVFFPYSRGFWLLANVLAAKRLPTVTVPRGAAPSSKTPGWVRKVPLWAAAILTGAAIVLLGGTIFSVVSVAPLTSWTTSAPKASNDHGTSGLLSVICVPGCESVYDNGELLGSSPIFKHPATLGSHRIRLVSRHPDVEKVISTIGSVTTASMMWLASSGK